ncbi:hypothetical protein HPG69_007656 [Diceros bicornis minor]|uniref:Uncharacterized protein n=1 Tax=Diceros bicornis minor TaxID=77932 RepID=A0A7J7EAD1_DICBM|nr:hypothetical protein HPG69_007656 [Diceros bicornis minor]
MLPCLAGTTPLFLRQPSALVVGCSTRILCLYQLAFTSHGRGSIRPSKPRATFWGFSPWDSSKKPVQSAMRADYEGSQGYEAGTIQSPSTSLPKGGEAPRRAF